MVKLAALAAVVLGLSIAGRAHTTDVRPAQEAITAMVAPSDVRRLEGECTRTTTFSGSGSEVVDERVSLSVRLDDAGAPKATVLLASPWDGAPGDLWRGWCHVARNDGQPMSEPCPVAPFELTTDALGLHDGYSLLRYEHDKLWLTFTASVEMGRDSFYDGSFSTVRYACGLQEAPDAISSSARPES